jgi:hypothetical protein
MRRFGERGQLSISDDAELSCGAAAGGGAAATPCARPALEGQTTSSPGGGSSSGIGFVIAPAADYFVLPGLSAGGQFVYEHLSTSVPAPGGGSTSASGDGWGFAPRVGYNINFGNWISLWPRAFVEYSNLSVSGAGNSTGTQRWTLGVFAPVLFHPLRHFYLGLGPHVATDLSSTISAGGHSGDGPKATEYGLLLTIGGWLSFGKAASAETDQRVRVANGN